MKRQDQEVLLGEFWASGTKRIVADATFRDWDDKANALMGKILDEMATSPAVKRLVEAVEGSLRYECDKDCERGRNNPRCENDGEHGPCPHLIVQRALAVVREEMGEGAPVVICVNCSEPFPEEELPDADMKGQVVCRKCIEKMALGD